MKNKAGVIVIAYNEEENIQDCINSILKQTFKKFDLIMVDDGSTDKTTGLIRTFNDPRIRHIKNETRQGHAISRNIGVSNSDADYIFFTDADCIVDKNWLKEGIKNFKKSTAAVGGITYKLIKKDIIHSSQKCELPTFATCNVAYKADILRKIGGFRERYNDGCEDTDLYERIKKHGEMIRNYKMIVYHKGKKFNIKRVSIILKRMKTLVYLVKDYYKTKNETFYEEKHTHIVNRVFMKFGNFYIIRPYFLLTIFVPPLLYWYLKKNDLQTNIFKFLLYFCLIYCYSIIIRFVVWKTAIKERCLVI